MTILTPNNAFPNGAFLQNGAVNNQYVTSFVYPGAVDPIVTGISVLSYTNAFPNGVFEQDGSGLTLVQNFTYPGAVFPLDPSPPPWGIPTNIGTWLNNSGNPTFTGVNVPAGGLVIFSVIEHVGSGNYGSVSDGTNTYSVAGQTNDGSIWFTLSVYYFYYPSGFSGTITYNKFGTSNCYASVFYITGAATSAQLDSGATAVAHGYNSASVTITSGAPAVANEFFIGVVSTDNVFSSVNFINTGSWVTPPNPSGAAAGQDDGLFGGSLFDSVGVAQTYNPSKTGAVGDWAGVIVAFKPGASGPQPETQPHFIAKAWPVSIQVLTALRQNAPLDIPAVQPETQPHFIARAWPISMRALPALRQNISFDTPPTDTLGMFIVRVRQNEWIW